jgi:carboxymethylenebutenolidase
MPDELRELNHLQRNLVEEAAEDFQHGQLTRRQALKMIAGVLGSLAAASSFLAACAPVTQPAPASSMASAAGSPTAAFPAASPLAPASPVGAATAPTVAAPTAAAAGAAATTTLAAPTPAQVAEATRSATQAVITTTATAATRPSPSVPPDVRVRPDDPAITAGDAQLPGQAVTLLGYLSRPKGDGAFPPVLVCHENRGLTDYIKDVTRRLAKAGYVALAVDLLSRQGGTAKVADPNSIPGLLSQMAPEQTVGDFQSGLAYLQAQPYVIKDRPGMIGFCFGGGVTWLAATRRIPALRAVVPFYGPNPPLADVPNIQAAVLAIYGALDQRIDAGIPAIEQAMAQNKRVFEKVIEPDANHAFHNDTGANYNAQAAQDAWTRALAWFQKYLKA